MAHFEYIISAEAELQHNWSSHEARERLDDAQAALHEVRQQKFQYQESAILSKWARVGDRCMKEFFEHHSGAKRPSPITKMLDGENLLTTQADLEAHILAFYRNLYTRDEAVESNIAAREDCFTFIKRTVTEAHNADIPRIYVCQAQPSKVFSSYLQEVVLTSERSYAEEHTTLN